MINSAYPLKSSMPVLRQIYTGIFPQIHGNAARLGWLDRNGYILRCKDSVMLTREGVAAVEQDFIQGMEALA